MPCVYHEVLLTASLLVRTVCVQRHGRAGGLPSHGVSCQKTQTGISQQTVLVTKTGNFTRIGRYTPIATFPLPSPSLPRHLFGVGTRNQWVREASGILCPLHTCAISEYSYPGNAFSVSLAPTHASVRSRVLPPTHTHTHRIFIPLCMFCSCLWNVCVDSPPRSQLILNAPSRLQCSWAKTKEAEYRSKYGNQA